MARRHAVRGGGGRFVPKRKENYGLDEFVFEDTLTPGLIRYDAVFQGAVAQACRDWGKRAVEHMRENAPWNDRTGDARAGLDYQIDESVGEIAVTLFHTVSYGVWLEVRWNGAYAIIQPTLEELGPELMHELEVIVR